MNKALVKTIPMFQKCLKPGLIADSYQPFSGGGNLHIKTLEIDEQTLVKPSLCYKRSKD